MFLPCCCTVGVVVGVACAPLMVTCGVEWVTCSMLSFLAVAARIWSTTCWTRRSLPNSPARKITSTAHTLTHSHTHTCTHTYKYMYRTSTVISGVGGFYHTDKQLENYNAARSLTHRVQYSQKYWRSLNLAVWSKPSIKNIGRI